MRTTLRVTGQKKQVCVANIIRKQPVEVGISVVHSRRKRTVRILLNSSLSHAPVLAKYGQ